MNIRKRFKFLFFFSTFYPRIWGVWDLGNVGKYGLILSTAQWQICTGSSTFLGLDLNASKTDYAEKLMNGTF